MEIKFGKIGEWIFFLGRGEGIKINRLYYIEKKLLISYHTWKLNLNWTDHLFQPTEQHRLPPLCTQILNRLVTMVTRLTGENYRRSCYSYRCMILHSVRRCKECCISCLTVEGADLTIRFEQFFSGCDVSMVHYLVCWYNKVGIISVRYWFLAKYKQVGT